MDSRSRKLFRQHARSLRRQRRLEHDHVRLAARDDERSRDVPNGAPHRARDAPVLLHERLELRAVVFDREAARAPGEHDEPRAVLDGRSGEAACVGEEGERFGGMSDEGRRLYASEEPSRSAAGGGCRVAPRRVC